MVLQTGNLGAVLFLVLRAACSDSPDETSQAVAEAAGVRKQQDLCLTSRLAR